MISRLTALVTLLSCLLFDGTASGNVLLERALEDIKSSEIAPLLPRKAYLQNRGLLQVKLSPDGNSIVYHIDNERHDELWKYDVESQKHTKLITIKSMAEFHWSADSQAIFYVAAAKLFWLDSSKPNQANQLYDFSNPNVEFLRPDRSVSELLWFTRYVPRTQQHQLLKLTLTGEEEVVYSSKHAVKGFLSHEGQAVIVQYWVNEQINIARLSGGEIETLIECNLIEPCHALHWQNEKEILLLSTYGDQDVLGVYQYDVSKSTLTLVHQDPTNRFDVSNTLFDDDGNLKLASYRTDFRDNYALDVKTQNVLTRIDQRLKSNLLYISASDLGSVWLIIDDDPGLPNTEFHLYVSETEEWHSPLKHLTRPLKAFENAAPRVPFWYSASDGMSLQGYVTLPVGYQLDQVPLVVAPHGGPWNRSLGNRNRHAQFLANRGYAVFEPNFRASTGLGRNYVFSANRDFGKGRVQQDIIDGTEYLLSLGVGDRNQLAIAGHSFGGFSALNALAFTPDMFKVGFAGAAPSNLSNTVLRFAKNVPQLMVHRNMARFKTLMVDIEDSTDMNRLYEQSPDKHWGAITQPLYLWGGEKDKRVAIEDIRSIAVRLENSNREVALLSAPKEGHSPESELAQEAYLYMLEKALATHLNGQIENTLSQSLHRYLNRYVLIDTAGFIVQQE